jgi:DNA-binding transcriptional MerR regulator
METVEELQFTASDAKKVGGVTYRQLNDWDSKGALPNQQREQGAGWRKFDPKRFFVLLVCAEMRKQFGIPIEKLAWLQRFMLQDDANHFLAAVRMMERGLAVLIFTDFCENFNMDSDFDIADLLKLGYCTREEPQSYVLLSVNSIVNKMLAALKKPVRLNISEATYRALASASAEVRVRDTAELAVLQAMRRPNVSRLKITELKSKKVLIESDMKKKKRAGAASKNVRSDLFTSKIIQKVDRKRF